jgi:hypothetical protein
MIIIKIVITATSPSESFYEKEYLKKKNCYKFYLFKMLFKDLKIKLLRFMDCYRLVSLL